MTPKIHESDLTFVFQGPELFLAGKNITFKAISSARINFPYSKIIFSTWDGIQKDQYTKLGIEVITSRDPGSELRDSKNGIYLNIARQMKSTAEGLSLVKTKYAIKLRSDLELKNRRILQELNSKKVHFKRSRDYSHFTNRVIVLDVTSINPRFGEQLPFHPCDWLYAGLTSDLRLLFPMSLKINEKEISEYYKLHQKPENNPFPDSTALYHPESFIFSNSMKIFRPISFAHLSDTSGENIELSEKLIFNNLMISSLRKLGVVSLKHKIKISNYRRTYSQNLWKNIDKRRLKLGTLDTRYIVSNIFYSLERASSKLKRISGGLKTKKENE